MSRHKKCDYHINRKSGCDTVIHAPYKGVILRRDGFGFDNRKGAGHLRWLLCDYHYELMNERENKHPDNVDPVTGGWIDPTIEKEGEVPSRAVFFEGAMR